MKFLVLVLSLAGAVLIGQTAGQTPANPTTPPPVVDASVRSDAAEVVIDMVVRDKRGRPIRDLKKEELTVTDEGTKVDVRELRLVTESGSSSVQQNAKNENGLDASKQVRLITILMEPMTAETSRLARESAMAIIKKTLDRNNLFSVLEVRGKVRVLCPYTNDETLLKKAVDAGSSAVRSAADLLATQAVTNLRSIARTATDQVLRGDLSGLRETAPDPAGTSFCGAPCQSARLLLNVMESSMQQEREFRAIGVLNSLRAAIIELGKLPGRKSLIYFSIGLQIPTRFDPLFEDTLKLANTNGVVIYTIDANGLDVSSRNALSVAQVSRAVADMADADSSSPSSMIAAIKGVDTALEAGRNQNVTKLMEIAQGTGGIYLGDSNDINKMAQKVSDDIATYYEITYTLPNATYDGAYRSVDVKLDRKNTVVQARKGYFAIPPEQKSTISSFEVPLLKALQDKDAPQTFALDTAFASIRPVGEKVALETILEIPLDQVELREDPAAKLFRMRVATLLTFRRPDGTLTERISRDLAFQGPLERIADARKGKYSWHQALPLEPGEYTAELAVMDRNSDKISVVRRPVKVASLSGTLAISEPVLAKRMDVRNNMPDDELLRMGNYAVTPQVPPAKLEVAGMETTVPVFLSIHRDSLDKPIKLEAEIIIDGIAAGGRTELPLGPDAAKQNDIPYVANLPAKGLEAGSYEVRFIASNGADESASSIKLEIGEAPGIVRPPPVAAAKTNAGASSDSGPEVALTTTTIRQLDGIPEIDAEQQKQIIDTVTERAREWVRGLPNFFCLRTDRLMNDLKGEGKFKEVGVIQGIEAVIDGKEQYSPIEKSKQFYQDDTKPKNLAQSHGEFGGLVRAIFDADAKAKFQWKGFAMLGEDRVHILEYTVERLNSKFKLTWPRDNEVDQPGYKGLVFLEEDTLQLRRITLETVGVRARFPLQQATHEVDYELIKIADVQYLLPTHAVMQSRIGKRKRGRSEITFRDYRKWGAESRMIFEDFNRQ